MEEKPNVAGLFYFEIFSAGIRKVSFRFGLGIRIMSNFCFVDILFALPDISVMFF